jgi:hypothetical protein
MVSKMPVDLEGQNVEKQRSDGFLEGFPRQSRGGAQNGKSATGGTEGGKLRFDMFLVAFPQCFRGGAQNGKSVTRDPQAEQGKSPFPRAAFLQADK